MEEVTGEKDSQHLKDFDQVVDVMLSRLQEFEGPNFEFSRLKQFQKSLFDFISSDTIPKEEVDGRYHDLRLRLSQIQTSSQADVMRIQRLEAEAQGWKDRSVFLQDQIKAEQRKRITREEERNQLRTEALETLLLATPNRAAIQSRISQLELDIAKLRAQGLVLKKFEHKTKRNFGIWHQGIRGLLTKLEKVTEQNFLADGGDGSSDQENTAMTYMEEESEPAVSQDGNEVWEQLQKTGNDFLGDWSPAADEIRDVFDGSPVAGGGGVLDSEAAGETMTKSRDGFRQEEEVPVDEAESDCDSSSDIWSVIYDLTET